MLTEKFFIEKLNVRKAKSKEEAAVRDEFKKREQVRVEFAEQMKAVQDEFKKRGFGQGPGLEAAPEAKPAAAPVAKVAPKPIEEIGLGEADFGGISSAEAKALDIGGGVVETALTLTSGMFTWMGGKVAAAPARLIGETDIAEDVEEVINDLTYKPTTDTAKVVTQHIGSLIDMALYPVHWWGEKMKETMIEPLKGDRSAWGEGTDHPKASKRAVAFWESFTWFGELSGELLLFNRYHKVGKIAVDTVKRGNFNLKANKKFFDEAITTLETAKETHLAIANDPVRLNQFAGRKHRMRRADGTIEQRVVWDEGELKLNNEKIAAEKQQVIDILNEASGDFELAKTMLDGWRKTHIDMNEHMTMLEDLIAKHDKPGMDYSDVEKQRIQEYKDNLADKNKMMGSKEYNTRIIEEYNNVELQLDKSLKQAQKHPLIQKLMRADKYGLEMKNLILDRHGGIKGAEMDSHTFRQGIESRLTKPERHAALFLIEKIPVRELQKLANEGKIPQATVDIASRPSKAMVKEVTNLRKFYKESHEFLSEHHENVGFHENYVNRVWDLTGKERKALGDYFTRTNKFLKQRTIPTVADGLNAGYKLATTDILDLVKVYDSYKIKTSYNNKFAEGIFEMADHEYGKLINTYDKIPEAFRHDFTKVDYAALKKAVYRGSTKGKLPIVEMSDVWVHKDILPYVRNIFEPKFKGKVLGYVEGVNAVGKKSNLVFSFFHNLALFEGAVGHGIVIKGSYRIIKGMMEGKAYAVSTPEMIRRTKVVLKDGVTLDPLKDHHIGHIQKGLDNIATKVSGLNRVAGAPVKALAWANKKFDRVLFDYVHSTLKLLAHERNIEIELGKLAKTGELGKMTSSEIRKVRQNIAVFTNDSFGGQLWELNKHVGDAKTQQLLQLSLLSPDWTFSTVKQAAAPVVGGKGVAGWKGAGARFWTRAMIISFIVLQGTNLLNSQRIHGKARFTWENPKDRQTYVIVGKGLDGEDLYARVGKQFREGPEWLAHPWDKLGGKLSPILQAFSHQFFSASGGSGFPAEWKRKPDESEALLRAKTLATDLTPFSLRHYITGQPGPIALSIPVSKGMSKYQAHEQLVDALQSEADEGEMVTLRKHILENGLPYKELLKQAEGDVKRIEARKFDKLGMKIYRKYQAGAMSMADLLDIEREKSGLPPKEWRHVRKKFKKLIKEHRSVSRQKRRYGIDQHLVP